MLLIITLKSELFHTNNRGEQFFLMDILASTEEIDDELLDYHSVNDDDGVGNDQIQYITTTSVDLNNVNVLRVS